MIPGLDLSAYQRQHRDGTPLPFDPAAVAAAGYVFAIARLGHGLTADPWGADSVRQLRAAGLRCSVYWYQEAAHGAEEQRDAYLGALDGLDLDFAPALDVEEGGDGTAERAMLILDALPRDHGLPLLYTMPEEGAHAHFARCPALASCSRLWEAHWRVASPMACPPWAPGAWAIWQHDNAVEVPGVGRCDADWMRGALW